MDIFASEPGTVNVIGDQKVLPGRIRIANPAFPSGSNVPLLVAGIDYNQATNQQFQSTLDGSVFIYVFGDRMGDIVVQGVAFKALCTGGGKSGIEELFEFYGSNRASVRAEPVIVEAAGTEVRGFLTAIKVRDNILAEDPGSPMSNFSLFISSLPKRESA